VQLRVGGWSAGAESSSWGVSRSSWWEVIRSSWWVAAGDVGEWSAGAVGGRCSSELVGGQQEQREVDVA